MIWPPLFRRGASVFVPQSRWPRVSPDEGPGRRRRGLFSSRRRRREEDAAAREVLAVLELQMRLSRLTTLLREIAVDPDRFARQHHWRSTLWAYDSILADACVVAGVEVIDAEPGPKADEERTRRELELCACGWNW